VTGWENDTVYYDPPIAFGPGDTLDFHCDYDNPTSEYFFDGFSARHDEMCVTGGVYFRHGDRLPITEEVTFGGGGIVFTGSNSCQQIAACDEAIDYSNWTQVPNPQQQFELCLIAGCNGAVSAYGAYDGCRYTMCKDECLTIESDGRLIDFKYDDPACTSCVGAKCAAERDACPTVTCP